MSEVFITYNITLSEEELGIVTEMVEKGSMCYDLEGAIISGILEQILDQAKGKK